MNQALIDLVVHRAGNRCEYCRLPRAASSIPFEIDHVIARKHGGPTSRQNLALACFYCNSAKGPNVAGIDPQSGRISRLFNPRKDRWRKHFTWDGAYLRGLPSVGRATLAVLMINDPAYVTLRRALLAEGVEL